MNAPKCRSCDVVMTEGCIPDFGYGRVDQQSWMEGPPEKSLWLQNLKLSGKRRFAITAYRCPNCGKVELYAVTPVD